MLPPHSSCSFIIL
jgi:hypothetical protein